MNFLDSADDPKRAERWPLYYFLLASLAVGAAASLFTEPNLGWYASLARPSFAPPAWLLPPVWTALYVLMAVAAWRAWKITGLKSTTMALYALQLAFTFVWTALFFGGAGFGCTGPVGAAAAGHQFSVLVEGPLGGSVVLAGPGLGRIRGCAGLYVSCAQSVSHDREADEMVRWTISRDERRELRRAA
jgi:tryptophan-rich sensory protein